MTENRKKGNKAYQKYLAFIILWIAIMVAGFIFAKKDAFLYKHTIVQITDVKTKLNSKAGQTDPDYWQEITAVVLNNKYKNKTVTFTNTYTKSLVTSEKYAKNDQIFVQIKQSEDKKLLVSLIEVKRDAYLFLLVSFLFLSLVFLAKRQGVFTILSLIANVTFFFFCFHYMQRKIFFTFAWMILAVCFCVITLLLSGGFRKKTFGALFSSFVCVGIMAVLYQFSIYQNHQISYELMPDMVNSLPLRDIYRTSVMIGLLGAVMDVSITINASVGEIIATNPCISLKEVVNSIQEIGYDIMGTMVNILFFSYIGSSLPLLVLKIYHNYDVISIFQNTLIFDAGRFLIGAIGIVIAIPISGFFAVLLFYQCRRKSL